MANPWPTVNVDTTLLDSGSDDAGDARTDLLFLVSTVNTMVGAQNSADGVVLLDTTQGGRPSPQYAGAPNFASAYLTTVTSTANGDNIVNFGTDDSDTTGFTDLVTNPTRITIPNKTPSISAVRVIGSVQVIPPTLGSPPSPPLRYELSLRMNGGTTLYIGANTSASTTLAAQGRIHSDDVNEHASIYIVSPKLYVSTGDYFELNLNNPNSGQPQAQYTAYMSVMVLL